VSGQGGEALAIALEVRPEDDPGAPGEAIRVRGLVQGVGFRPHAFRLAADCGLCGEVWNDAEGVLVQIWGPEVARRRFRRRLRDEAPPLARIDTLETLPLSAPPPRGFRILASHAGAVRTGVVPDAATCPACLAEIRDPDDRRHRYPFTNCTHCGPRLSIVRRIPYDRAGTSMAEFTMCRACQAEYADPTDRRFHAQPNACACCGPKVWLEGARAAGAEPIAAARALLAAGEIVAIKGVGGFHLAADATDAEAVQRLRARKRRYHKPFALMAGGLEVIQRYCAVNEDERALLESPAAPIVILAADGPERVAADVAPGQRTLGFMLPYTPLHHLLLEGLDRPIVLTSGNLSEEPQCTGNEAARAKLSGIADHLLMHDRAIVNRVDDSVIRVMDGAPRVLRRARGYAPAPLPLPEGFASAPALLAMGGELKSTFCVVQDGRATLSQHIGDLEDAATYADYRASLALYRSLLEHDPLIIAVDQHPDYLSTKLGRELGHEVVAVQHHHAHIAACLAENGVSLAAGPVLGVALDGLGYGEDGTIWGGEFLLADYRGCTRLAHLRPVPMVGGVQAIREPWRNAYAQIRAALGWERFAREHADLELCADLRNRPLATLDAMLAKGLNCPLSSSCGRLFDAVAAALGICRAQACYEGQAAIELEASVDAAALDAAGDGYPFVIERAGGQSVLDPGPMWPALLADLARGTPVPVIAARFHLGLTEAILELVCALSRGRVDTVALSGGVFQNRLLFERVSGGLRERGFSVLSHRLVPANDGGLALGQAAIAAARALAPRTDHEVAICV
jgi:hydrogenase maturation protein HypF